MGRRDLSERYFEWMCALIVPKRNNHVKLLRYLNNCNFVYQLPMDSNRAMDGIDLRYHFGEDCGYDQRQIASELDIRPCSVFEMLVALARRAENDILCDFTYGDRTNEWFWIMLDNLGLSYYDDYHYDEEAVDDILMTFLYRKYDRDGRNGNIFYTDTQKDFRSMDIWYQMCHYFN